MRTSDTTLRRRNDDDITTPDEAQGNAYEESWFDLDGEDLPVTVEDTDYGAFANRAIWEERDPPFDFEHDPRPATDGSTDFPGADTIPGTRARAEPAFSTRVPRSRDLASIPSRTPNRL